MYNVNKCLARTSSKRLHDVFRVKMRAHGFRVLCVLSVFSRDCEL